MAEEIIKMVANAIGILGELRKDDEAKTIKEISENCKISISATSRILKTLENDGWVTGLNESLYIAGEKTEFVTEKTNLHRALADAAGVILEKYVERHQEAMNLMILEGGECEIIQQGRTKNLINYIPQLHAKLPFYSCAGGKILISELSESMKENLFRYTQIVPMTSNTICDQEILMQEIEEVKKCGYATDFHEILEMGSCIAVPVRDNEGTIIASLSYSGILNIKDKDDLLQYVPSLKEASEEISHMIYKCWEEAQKRGIS